MMQALALEQAHQARLRERVEIEVEADERRRTVSRNGKRLLRNRKHGEEVAVGMVVRRRTWAEIAGNPQIRPRLQRTCRKLAGFRLPASSGNSVTVAGMLTTSQCQNPLPVGASGSKQVMAKLFVSLGAPDHARCGDWLPPAQPKPNSFDKM